MSVYYTSLQLYTAPTSGLLKALAMKEPLHSSFRHLQGEHAYLEETDVPHNIICVQSKAIPVLVCTYEASPVCMASGRDFLEDSMCAQNHLVLSTQQGK